MKIEELLSALDVLEVRGDMDADICEIIVDSRKSGPGKLFVCIDGYTTVSYTHLDVYKRQALFHSGRSGHGEKGGQNFGVSHGEHFTESGIRSARRGSLSHENTGGRGFQAVRQYYEYRRQSNFFLSAAYYG